LGGQGQAFSMPTSMSMGNMGGYGGGGMEDKVEISPPMYTTVDGTNITMQMGVPDALVGSVLGKVRHLPVSRAPPCRAQISPPCTPVCFFWFGGGHRAAPR